MKQRAIHKVMHVLDLFSPSRPEWGVGEVAEALGISKTTASEMMTALTEHRALRRGANGRYRLGWRLFELSQAMMQTTEYRSEALRAMDDLCATWKESVHLAVLDDLEVVCVGRRQPKPTVRIAVSWTGARLPPHCSAVGKVLLADREWEEVREVLGHRGMPAFTSHTITGFDGLREELAEVRQLGYAYNLEEIDVGLCCVAAPVLNAEGRLHAALSISAPAFRFEARKQSYTAAVMEAAARLSSSIGFPKPEARHRVRGLGA